ncbi:hypothetical protein LXM24_02205 [Dyadobacter sp. CY399]|uniref:Uncharacterized protein n=1 Tax=Dyadobacter fanqingshengii TaxID=2906443 RepID=A0A9X1P6J9_9BACT|nr:hypothetical protein [Dyadobacter fanqingshengii]MCF0038882.1 hypothetical protein [Dyadobacter fanqingshengii]
MMFFTGESIGLSVFILDLLPIKSTLPMRFTSKQPFNRTVFIKCNLIVILICLLTLSACREAETDPNEKKAYYDLKGFVENQIVYLNEKKPKVAKTVQLDGKKEVRAEIETDWKKELELFAQADINKPAYRNSYSVIKNDSAIYEYKIKDGENLPVRYLMIKVDSATQQPVLVKAILRSENRIYSSEKTIELMANRRNNMLEVSAYTVKGYQKLLFTNRKSFNISAKIGL